MTLSITPVDAAAGAARGDVNFLYLDKRWPANLESDVSRVVDFIKGVRTPFTPARR